MYIERLVSESREVVNLPPDKNIPEGKPSLQNSRKWAWLGCVIGASIDFHGPSSGQWPCDRNVFLTLVTLLRYLLQRYLQHALYQPFNHFYQHTQLQVLMAILAAF